MKENSFVNRRLAENVVNRDLLCAVASGFLVKVRAGQKPLWGATFHAGSLIALAALFVEPLATQCYSSPWALRRR